MQANRFSIPHGKLGPIPIAEILQFVLARYAPAGTFREDDAPCPAGRGISITVVEVEA
jgi:hypothetical protein